MKSLASTIALAGVLVLVSLGCGDDSSGGGGAAGQGGDGQGAAAATGSSSGSTSGSSSGSSSGASTTASTGATSGGGGEGGVGGAGQGGTGEGGAGQGGGGAGSGGAAADGYGGIAGTCGSIDLRDILSAEPSLVLNAIDFTGEPAITQDDTSALTPGGQEIIADGNLGGSSLWSEAFAYEILARCEGAELLKTEAEIVYATEGKKTDELVLIDTLKVGVSVVRAVSFPEGDAYTVDDALPVLEGKLDDILQSSVNVAPEDAWEKQILSVLAQTEEHAQAMLDAYDLMDATTRGTTIVVVTTTHGDDAFIYYGD